MSATTEQPESEYLAVRIWRFERLLEAGYPHMLAIRIAEREDIDLHVACKLLLRGATPRQALQILF